MIIGLCGYARAGKDSVAKALAGTMDFRRYAFADQLKEVALHINPWMEIPYQGFRRLEYVVKDNGWENAKDYGDVRRFLQNLGTAVRDYLDEDAWLDYVVNQIGIDQPDDVVITDVRFPNEAAWVRKVGHLVRVTRPGVAAVNGHVSENVLDALGVATLHNDGTLADLGPKVLHLVNLLEEEAA